MKKKILEDLKKFFFENDGKHFKTITAVTLIVTLLVGIQALFFSNSSTTTSDLYGPEANISKIVIGLDSQSVSNLLGPYVLSTTETKRQIEYFISKTPNIEIDFELPEQLISNYYIFDHYIVRCIFDNDRLIAYFFTIRERGNTLPENLIEIVAIGGTLGKDTYNAFGTGFNYPNKFYGNLPANNNQHMYYGEIFSPVPGIYHYIMICSLDYGFTNTTYKNKEENHQYYKLADIADGYYIPFMHYWFNEGHNDILDYALDYNRMSGSPWDVNSDYLSSFLNSRNENMPNTVGVIEKGYEYMIEPLDHSLNKGEITMFSNY